MDACSRLFTSLSLTWLKAGRDWQGFAARQIEGAFAMSDVEGLAG